VISIQTNVNSLVAQQNLSVTSAFQSKTIQQLTSGYRINQSGDDAAGLAVANKFRSTIAELTQGVANGNDATAQLQIMDGGMSNISSILDRLKTLATQSASGTFTGNRATVNSEFQNDLAEIDRQAQSIGLNTGGSFAKNLDVYLGEGSGSSSLQNGVVTLGLAASSVDSQSLGMKGMQALGTADLGTGNSSVASIVGNTNNRSTETTAGYATFSFSGAGFSDAGKVKVQVNLSGVSDAASLVTAFNSAITSAGTGSPQALAFAKAGIVASVTTDGSGQHLAFTSGTSAFQVQAGDKIGNAVLGNFLGSTSEGADIATTVTGGTTAAMTAPTTTAFAPGGPVQVRIQGSGLAAPIELTIASGIGQVSDAISNLQSQVSAKAELQAAGISLSVVNNQLTFTSKSGESLSIMATGDKTNQLGLGSFVTNSSSHSAVDYSSIDGAVSTYAATTKNDTATMQISIGGAAATDVSVALTDKTLGATASSTTTTTALSNANIASLNGDTLSVSVDGITATTVALSGSAAGSLQATAGVGTPTFVAESSGVATGTLAPTTMTLNNALSFTVNVDSGITQTINIAAGTYNNGLTTDTSSFIHQINASLVGATATEASGIISITSNSPTGTSSIVNLTDGLASAAKAAGSAAATFTATDFVTANVAANTFKVSVDGTTDVTVTMTKVDSSAQDLVNDINYNNGTAHAAFTAVLSGAANDRVSIVSTGAGGARKTIQITSDTLDVTADLKLGTTLNTGDDTALTTLKLATQTGAKAGINGNNQFMISSDTHLSPTLVTIGAGAMTSANAVATMNAALQTVGLNNWDGTTATTGIIASLNGSSLVLSSATVGAASRVTIGDPTTNPANSALTALHMNALASNTGLGGTATAASIANLLQGAIDAATGGSGTNAGAKVSLDSSNHLVITNNNAGAGHTISVLSGTAVTSTVLDAGTQGLGADLTGSQLANALNQKFAGTDALQKADLNASWNTGTGQLSVVSGNNTNFRVNSGTTAIATTATSTTNLAAGIDFAGAPTPANKQAFQISTNGGASFTDIVLNTDTRGAGLTGANNVISALNTALAATGAKASLVTVSAGVYGVSLSSTTAGATSNIQVQGMSAADATAGYSNALAAGKVLAGLGTARVTADADLGFGVSGSSFIASAITTEGASANLTSATPKNFVVDAGGASQALVDGNALAFKALQYGNDSQAITISANDAGGNQQSTTITLANAGANTSGRTIDEAVSFINKSLQDSNNATLQKVVAVKQNVAGEDKINFISSLASFNVGVGSTANLDGINNGASANVAGKTVGAGANMQVDTKEGALAALVAITAAVAKLGSAQAAVGKGQNQLTYAVTLAQSQITNFSAAESQIRDANVAQQAANLSKAQTLSQASIAAMAQANSAPQAVLSLLRG
jgi:flagellin